MTTRRHFITGAILFGAGTVGLVNRRVSRGEGAGRTRAALALPTPAQLAWQDLELGMFVHFAPNTWQDREYDDRSTPLSAMNPDIDTDQWVEAAEAFGARWVVLVAKHVGGFCLWQTDTTEYSIKNTPWRGGRGDVMADLSASCERRGLGLGVYLSPRDDSQRAGGAGRCATPEGQRAYDAIYRRQLTELLTRYGPIVEVWFDGSSVIPTGDLLAAHAPDAMIFQGPQATIRWVGNEDGFAPYPAWNALRRSDAETGIATAIHGDPDGDVWMPLEVDVSLRRPNWFWSTTNAKNILTLDQLLEIYYRSVGRGAQLLLNVPPDRTGHVPQPDLTRLREFGAEVWRRFGSPVAEVSGAGRTLTLQFDSPQTVDHVVLEEDLTGGQRVRAYRLEGAENGRWIALGEGSAIGHKRIQPVGPATVRALRLVVTESAGEPSIRRFAAFATGSAAPPTWNDPAHLWADDAVGGWDGPNCDVDLTERISAAGRYRVRLVPRGGGNVSIAAPSLTIGSTNRPDLIRADPGRSDTLILMVPGLGERIRFRARIGDARAGTVLLRRI